MKDRLRYILEKLKIQNKKTKIIMLCIILVIIMFVVISVIKDARIVNVSKEQDSVLIKNEYEELNDVVSENGKKYPKVNISNNRFEYSDVNNIVDIFKNQKDAVVFFGYPSCVYCRTAIQMLHDTVIDTEINKIYYVDTIDNNNNFELLEEFLEDDLIVTKDEHNEIYSPLVLFITDGEVISYKKGTIFSQRDPYVELDEYQKKGLVWLYKNGIDNVVQSIKLKEKNK